MNRVRAALSAFLLLVSLLLFLPARSWAQEKPAGGRKKTGKASVEKAERKGAPAPALTKEDRAIVQNLDLLEKMALLQDMDVLASTEEKK